MTNQSYIEKEMFSGCHVENLKCDGVLRLFWSKIPGCYVNIHTGEILRVCSDYYSVRLDRQEQAWHATLLEIMILARDTLAKYEVNDDDARVVTVFAGKDANPIWVSIYVRAILAISTMEIVSREALRRELKNIKNDCTIFGLRMMPPEMNAPCLDNEIAIMSKNKIVIITIV